jgi:sec-independent protein translocase protein TatC
MTMPSAPGGPTVASDDAFDATEPVAADGSRMTFLEHLDELRRRILYALYAVLACGAIVVFYIERIYRYGTAYFAQVSGVKLIYSGMTEGFAFEMKLGILLAVLMASPFIFAQIWFFVAPGLYVREKRLALPFITASTLLFGTGAWFCHAYAFPSMFKFFASFQNGDMAFFPTIREVSGFYVKMILGFGLVFEMPLLVFCLARFGMITARFMIKQFKYAFLIIFVLAAIITPSSDIPNQLMFAAPMLILYVVSIGVAWLFGKKRAPAA